MHQAIDLCHQHVARGVQYYFVMHQVSQFDLSLERILLWGYTRRVTGGSDSFEIFEESCVLIVDRQSTMDDVVVVKKQGGHGRKIETYLVPLFERRFGLGAGNPALQFEGSREGEPLSDPQNLSVANIAVRDGLRSHAVRERGVVEGPCLSHGFDSG